MKVINNPTFCSSFSKEWVFPIPVPNVSLCHCTFNKDLFMASAYAENGITQPEHLHTAIPKRNAEYLIGRLCAKKALADLNIDDYPLINPDKSPQWPALSCGSISHSKQLAAAIVALKSHWQGLGLDIEYLLTKPRSEKLLSTIVNQQERQLVDDDISLFTTLAFSIKESLFKALYPLTGKRFYFENAEIINWNKQGTVTLKLLIDLSEKWQKGTLIKGQYSLREDYLWSLVAITN